MRTAVFLLSLSLVVAPARADSLLKSGVLTGVAGLGCLIAAGVLNADYKSLKGQAAERVLEGRSALAAAETEAEKAMYYNYLEGGWEASYYYEIPSAYRDHCKDQWDLYTALGDAAAYEMKYQHSLAALHFKAADMMYEDAGTDKGLFAALYAVGGLLAVSSALDLYNYLKGRDDPQALLSPAELRGELVPGGGRLCLERHF